MTGGLLILDKPAGMTSHDVVARVRRILGTRKVGHAGTLDPMATGVLLIGVDKATRLLGYLTLDAKEYRATIRLGQATSTDDAEGEVLTSGPRAADDTVTDAEIAAAVAGLTGPIDQVPPKVSAIKVNGQRAYKLTRAGQDPDLKPRPVTVHGFSVTACRREEEFTDLDAVISCSSGTYIRSLARDLGARLGTGGHLTALRRTRSGPYTADSAVTLTDLEESQRTVILPTGMVASMSFPRRDLSETEARILAHGGRIPAGAGSAEPVAAFAPDGSLVALVSEVSGAARPLAVFA